MGHAILPCLPRSKHPALPPLKADGTIWRKGIDPLEARAVQGSFHRASTSADAIAAWEQENPHFNPAVALGGSLLATVVEADGDTGNSELDDITRAHPLTVAWRGKRGVNRMYAGLADLAERPVRNLWPETFGKEIEFKNGQGLVVMPEAIHPEGPTYRFLPGQAPWECGMQLLPGVFADEVRRLDALRLGENAEVISLTSHISHTPTIQKNTETSHAFRLYRVTKYLEKVEHGLSDGRKYGAYKLAAACVNQLECREEEMRRIVGQWNACNNPPLEPEILECYIADALQYGSNWKAA